MNRTKAVACYKEIVTISDCMGSSGFNLVSTGRNQSKTKDYQMHINMWADDEIKQQLSCIVKKYDLAVKEERDEIVIYTP
jgi:hypothetical protein